MPISIALFLSVVLGGLAKMRIDPRIYFITLGIVSKA